MQQVNTKTFGNFGEQLASDYLNGKGYRILQRNFVAFHTEIDIIALDESCNQIVFVEVKTLKDDYFQQPYEEVNRKKQKNIIKTANVYLQRCELDKEARFDIVSIVQPQGTEPKIEHIISAFSAFDYL